MMRRLFPLLWLITTVLTIKSASVSRYTGSRIFWDSRSPITIFNSGGYARVIELEDGRLMACCESGGIKVAFSSNKGLSWSSPRLIAPNTNNTPNCVPDLLQLSDGTIIVGYNPRPSQPYTGNRRFGIRVRRSIDNAETWSNEILVYDADSIFENGCWEPSFLELPNGELQLYYADEGPFTANSDQQISLCRSFDGGLTWSEPQRVSYRNGYRDGMPVPVLLSDKRNIVVAIEDNGWSGINDFVPTTVRTSISSNWKPYVNGSSTYRNRSVNYSYCPMAKGGAPYLRVLPNGETVMSHQSTYGDGDNMKMYVYVGNKQAKGFKAMSRPFYQGTKGCWWNSLAVVDSGTVVAVGGLDGKICMVKGRPMNSFQAVFGSPKVDGRISSSDNYYDADAHQIPMGSETGTFSYSDFAYDLDSLYFFSQVFRQRARSAEPFPDGINIYIESRGASTNVPMSTSYRFNILPKGTYSVSRGDGADWKEVEEQNAHIKSIVATSSYRVEMAVPWSAIGLDAVPIGKEISVNLEFITGDGSTQLIEQIPDALPSQPATWVLLNLIEPSADAIDKPSTFRHSMDAPFNLLGQPVSDGFRGIIVEKGKKRWKISR